MDVNKRFSPIMFTCMHCRTVIPVNIEIITSGTQMRSVSDSWERLEAREQAKSLWRRFVEFWTGVDPASIPSVEVSSAESTDFDVPLAFSKSLWEESFLVSRNTDPGKHPFLFLWWAIPLAVAFLIILYWVFFTFAKAL